LVSYIHRRSFSERGVAFKMRNRSDKKKAKKRGVWIRERRKTRKGKRRCETWEWEACKM